MSYILQALKKSEQERALAAGLEVDPADGVVKSVNDVEGKSESASSWPLYAIYLTLLSVMLLILWQILVSDKEIQYEESGQDTRMDVRQEIVTASAEKIEMSNEAFEAQQVKNPAQAEVINLERAPKEILEQIPKIEITSHIYSTDASRRSIVVNAKRLVEGDFIAPNLFLKQITAQGMIVDIQGWLLLIDRSRGWDQ